MGLHVTDMRGEIRYRKDGALLFDFNAARAIVRNGEVCELPDASLFNEPNGEDLISLREQQFRTVGGWVITGYGSFAISQNQGELTAGVLRTLLQFSDGTVLRLLDNSILELTDA